MIQQQFSSTFTSEDFILFHFGCYQNFPRAQAAQLGSSCHCFGWQSALSRVWVTIVWWGGRQRSTAPTAQSPAGFPCRESEIRQAWGSQLLQELLVWWMWWPEHFNSYLFTGRKVIISVSLSIVWGRGWDKDKLCSPAPFQAELFSWAPREGLSVLLWQCDGWTYTHMINAMSRPN